MAFTNLGAGESKLETAISYLLIAGVAASLFLEIIGILLFYHSYGHLRISENKVMFIVGDNFFSFIYGLFHGNYAQEKAIHFMVLGIIALILTPYIRLVLSVLYFAWERNVKYVAITMFVLAILTISLVLH